MINNIYGGGEFLGVNTYGASPNINYSNLSAGNLRFNPMNRNIEVYDGSGWQMMNGTAEISLSEEANDILRWAQKKKNQEERLKQLAEQNPTVADAVAQLQKAEEQLKIVVALCEEQSK